MKEKKKRKQSHSLTVCINNTAKCCTKKKKKKDDMFSKLRVEIERFHEFLFLLILSLYLYSLGF